MLEAGIKVDNSEMTYVDHMRHKNHRNSQGWWERTLRIMLTLATVLKEMHNPSIVIDFLMMNALSSAAPPSVKKVIIRMRSDYNKYMDRNSQGYRSFTSWLGSLPAELYTMSTKQGDQTEWMAFVERCSITCGTLSSHSGSTIPPGPSTTSTSSTCASGTGGRGGAAAERTILP
ncbi:hypothetical protein GE061_018590 [Apolygus lucorum]|uniref:Uncharacterized protein n=1 Tax=Apolygus lucorum TaxID=248454 RepID=A0A8S9XFM0_APOLU|nr:hypothetical protein GE061_018590 [Apolygus lucorum]